MSSINPFCIHPETHVREVEAGDGLNLNPNPPRCGACECPVVGKMYNCSACNSNLHSFCKSRPHCFSSHLHPEPGHPLTLLTSHINDTLRRRCHVCGEDIKGISYTCSPCQFDVHPQCSQLPDRVPHTHGSGQRGFLNLQVRELYDKKCDVCKQQCSRWVYSSEACSVNIHYWCLLKDGGEGDHQHRGRFLSYPFGVNGYGPGASSSSSWYPQPQFYGPTHPGYGPYHGNPWGGNPGNNLGGGGFGMGGLMNAMVTSMGSLAVNVLSNIVSSLIMQDFSS